MVEYLKGINQSTTSVNYQILCVLWNILKNMRIKNGQYVYHFESIVLKISSTSVLITKLVYLIFDSIFSLCKAKFESIAPLRLKISTK